MRINSVRIILITIGLLIGTVVTALYVQALAAMQQEQILYHQVIAEDAFDHIETQLALFVRDEEARPFTHYNFYYVPDEQVPGSVGLYKSPIADVPQDSPIVAYFQINPGGVVQFPHKSKNIDAKHNLNKEQQEKVATVCSATWGALNQAEVDYTNQEAPQIMTLANTSAIIQNDQAPQQMEQSQELFGNRSARSNWAKSYNTKVQQKVSKQSYYQASNSVDNGFQQQLQQVNEDPTQKEQSLRPQLIEQEIERYLEKNKIQNLSAYDIKTDEFYAVPVDLNQQLMLRNVTIGEQNYKQGFLLNINKLQDVFYKQFLKDTQNKSQMTLAWMQGDHQANTRNLHVAKGQIGFYHQLSAPFAHIGLYATMPIVEDQPGLSIFTLNVITGTLLCAIVLGLFMSDRTICVMQRFAERRQNFAAAVSHELKTPLTAIRMHAEMLESGMVANESKRDEYYHTIHAESQRLSRLIDNVLTLSRIEKDDFQLQMTIGDVKPVLDEAVAMIGPHAQRNGFSIEVEADGDLTAVRYDHDALMQILVNAIDNSIKFAKDADDKVIKISLTKQVGGLALRIRDFGPGVPQEHQAHVFEAFYRGERELTRTTKGTGIGLALVKNLCDAMGAVVTAGNATDTGFQLDIHLTAQS